MLRIIIGLPILLFIPGYMTIFFLFPSTNIKKKSIDYVERFVWSFALSIAIIPIIGIGLNYSPWGLRLQPILVSLELFIFIIGFLAIYRWFKTQPSKRFRFNVNISLPKDKDITDRILTIMLLISIFSFIITTTYVIFTPSKVNPFTEFYILNSKGYIDNYPTDLVIKENATIKIGIVNHEYATKTFIVEVWLINQTTTYNKTTKENTTIFHHMWHLFKIKTHLNHTDANINAPWKPQWEYNYTFNVTRRGYYKLFFLLFTNETQDYNPNTDYWEIAKQKINDAYAVTNLTISVSNRPKIYNVSAYPRAILQNGFINVSCSVFDIDGIENVFLNIHGPFGYRINESITDNKTGLEYYSNQSFVFAGEYFFYIWANDTIGNASRSSISRFTITDIPIISDVWTSSLYIKPRGFLNISCLIYDNDGINSIYLNITDPEGKVENYSIFENNTGFIYYSNRTYKTLGDYSYFIWVNDTVNNTNKSVIYQFYVTRKIPINYPPNITNVSANPSQIQLNGYVNISCMVFDVDGVDEVYLNITYPNNIVRNFSITKNMIDSIYFSNRTYSFAGDYDYFIWAIDTRGKSSISEVKLFTVIQI
jgi:uncharacterized membrane protein